MTVQQVTTTNPFAHLIIVANAREAFTYVDLESVDFPHTFSWSDKHKSAFSHIGIELPDAMTKAEAWDFLKKIKALQPKYKKHQKCWDIVIRCIYMGYDAQTEKVMRTA